MDVEQNQRNFEEATRRGSLEPMEIGKDYEVQDGSLVQLPADIASSRFYYPFAHPRVLTDFARLKVHEEDKVLQFARHWGHLRHYSRTPLTDAENRIPGDTLEFIWGHAEQVSTVLNLIDLRANWHSSLLRVYLSDLLEVQGNTKWMEYVDLQGRQRFFSWMNTALMPEGALEPLLLHNSDDPINTVNDEFFQDYLLSDNLILQIINANLESVSVRLEGNLGGRFIRSYKAGCLLAVIYLHLADAALGDKSYIRCEYCGNFFEHTHGRQRFCPSIKPGGQSPCSSRARMVRYRARKSQQAGAK